MIKFKKISSNQLEIALKNSVFLLEGVEFTLDDLGAILFLSSFSKISDSKIERAYYKFLGSL